MSKYVAIQICKRLLSIGFFAVPELSTYGDWIIRVNVSNPEWVTVEYVASLFGLRFFDYAYNPHDFKLNDFPLFYMPK